MIKETVEKAYREKPLLTIFSLAMCIILLINTAVAIYTRGESFYWTLHPYRTDAFMDFFNSVKYSSDRPYTYYKVIYPPLVTTVYAIIGKFIWPYSGTCDPYTTSAMELRGFQAPMMIFLLITALTLIIYRGLIRKSMDKCSEKEHGMIFAILLLSYPFIWGLERGNSILVCIIFIALFLLLYRSDKTAVRVLAYISLGIAAGIKIYPAIFAMLLLRERNYKGLALCVLVVFLLLLVPFVFTDGDVFILLDTVMNYSETVSCRFGIINLEDILSHLDFIPQSSLGMVSKTLSVLMLLVTVAVVFVFKNVKHWKMITLISCNLIVGFSVSTPYLFIYLVLGLIVFLNEIKTPSKMDVLYLICFIGIFTWIPALSFEQTYISTIKAVFLYIMIAALFYDVLKNGKNQNSPDKPVSE